MHLRVASAEALCGVDAIVLFAMTSPKLDKDSVFDGRPLHEIPYWRDTKRLCLVVQVEDQTYRLLFLSWQQNFAVHGTDDTHAKRNKTLLSKNERIPRLLEQEPQFAGEYIRALGDWCHATDRPLLLFRHFQRPVNKLQQDLRQLVESNRAVCEPTNLLGSNYKIMGCLIPVCLRTFARERRRT